MFNVYLRNVEAQQVAYMQKEVFAPELPSYISGSMQELVQHITAQGAEVSGAPFVVYHGTVSHEISNVVEVCVPVSLPVGDGEKVYSRVEPAHKEAYTRITYHQLVFPEIMQAYDAVSGILAPNGYICTGAPREVYFNPDPTPAPEDDYCDIAYVVQGEGSLLPVGKRHCK